MVLALATFMTNFGAISTVPPSLNYLIEAFSPALANEVSAALNAYRSTLAIAITFFLFPWAAKVGINWAFGMMAFFVILSFGGVTAVMIWGPKLRAKSLIHVESEEGIHIMNDGMPKAGEE